MKDHQEQPLIPARKLEHIYQIAQSKSQVKRINTKEIMSSRSRQSIRCQPQRNHGSLAITRVLADPWLHVAAVLRSPQDARGIIFCTPRSPCEPSGSETVEPHTAQPNISKGRKRAVGPHLELDAVML